jgi:23S rRNA (guanosine2251-2'-O)-methyltransferase
MPSDDFELILGLHSIVEALKNSERTAKKVIATNDAMSELSSKYNLNQKYLKDLGASVQLVKSHRLQEMGKEAFRKLGYSFQRIPSQIFLMASPLPEVDINWLYSKIKNEERIKVLCLDQVSDIHNGAAIVRTAAFYGVDCILYSGKGSFGRSPSLSRIASGGLEYVKLISCSSLSKTINRLKERGVVCIGFSEHSNSCPEKDILNKDTSKLCLVMGAEELGISNAVKRSLDYLVGFTPLGNIQSLNVSVASAVAMEKFFNK